MAWEWSKKIQNDWVLYERVEGGVEKREVALRGGSWTPQKSFSETPVL